MSLRRTPAYELILSLIITPLAPLAVLSPCSSAGVLESIAWERLWRASICVPSCCCVVDQPAVKIGEHARGEGRGDFRGGGRGEGGQRRWSPRGEGHSRGKVSTAEREIRMRGTSALGRAGVRS